MKIAIASGKGGTGKTTISTNLAVVASESGKNVTLLDCDVEEPNAHLFLKPEFQEKHPVVSHVPKVNHERCIGCGKCGDICQFSAIVLIAEKVLTYPELCHACGGCKLVCPTQAITEAPRNIGKIEIGTSKSIRFIHGLLNIGEAMSPPVIEAVRDSAQGDELVIIDAPPGTACPVIGSVRGVDYVVLVTEPTVFGLNDLKLAVDMVRALKLAFGVVINRADSGDDQVVRYCEENKISLLAEIPDDRRIAECYSRGDMICTTLPEYRESFENLLQSIVAKSAQRVNIAVGK